MVNKAIKLGIIILLFLFVVFYFFSKFNKYPCKELHCLQFPEKQLWKYDEVYESNERVWRGILSHPQYILRITKHTNISQDDAKEYTKISTVKMMSIYDSHQSPYPGAISNKIECSEEFKPQPMNLITKSDQELIYYKQYLNERMQPGICLESEVFYKDFLTFFYCSKTKEWYQIEIITKINDAHEENFFKNILEQIEC